MIKIAIVGRQNVGKSTLFNKLAGKRLSVVDKTPGVTRDPLKTVIVHRNYNLEIWDTGGYILHPSCEIEEKVREKIDEVIDSSDYIIFLTDGREGINPLDEEIALRLRKYGEKVILGVNKIDVPRLEYLLSEFHTLGFKKIFPVSAQTGRGIYEMLDEILRDSPPQKPEILEKEESAFKVVIAGRPNVGKSTLFNRIVGKERSIVSPIPGTTRDLIEEEVCSGNFSFKSIDTPGIRRRGKVPYGVEFFSIGRALDSILWGDAVIVVCDATEGIVSQDLKILSLALRKGKAVLICLNKWDLVSGNSEMAKKLESKINMKMKPFPYVPVINVSAKTGENLKALVRELKNVIHCHRIKIPTSLLNKVVKEATTDKTVSTKGGRPLKIYYSTQISTSPPHFVIFANTEDVPATYMKYLKNFLREKFKIVGTEIFLDIRGKER